MTETATIKSALQKQVDALDHIIETYSPKMAFADVEHLRAIRKTVGWMQTNETTVKGAVAWDSMMPQIVEIFKLWPDAKVVGLTSKPARE